MYCSLPWFDRKERPLYLAPMARYTDYVYRQICKEQGADVMVTEFVLADTLLREGKGAWEMVDFSHSQRPMGVQLFGSSPCAIAEAALISDLYPTFSAQHCEIICSAFLL